MNIASKVFLAMAFCCLVALVLFGLAMQWSLKKGFLNYLQALDQENTGIIVKRLEVLYGKHGDWNYVVDTPRVWPGVIDPNRPESEAGFEPSPPRPRRGSSAGPPPRPRGRPGPPGRDGPRDGRRKPPPDNEPRERRYSLYDVNRVCLIGPDPQHVELEYIPLKNRGQTVGWLSLSPLRTPTGDAARFVSSQIQAFLLISGILLIFALISSLLLSRHVTRSIPELATVTRSVARGEYSIRAKLTGRDEIGKLAEDINQMAQALESSQKHRHQFLSDVAHELKTPLAVLQGEIEAMLDGIRPLDQKALESLGAEVKSLTRLVQDLRVLAKQDQAHFLIQRQSLDLSQLVAHGVEGKQRQIAESGLELQLKISESIHVMGDAQRLKQVLDNLIANSIHYTDGPGKIHLSLQKEKGKVKLIVEDSKPGVDDEQLPLVFERLYRGDASRQKYSASSGLGLSITRVIVKQHGGSIWAEHSSLGGLKMVIELPWKHDSHC